MKKIVNAAFVLFIAAAAAAQSEPALTRDTRVLANDSPLVAAAKRAVAARKAAAAQGQWVIDDGMVRHRILADPAAPAQLPTVAFARSTSPGAPSTFSSNDGTAARQQAERQRAALQRELRTMAEENDQPYGGDVSEDRVAERMSQIPAQIDALPPPAPKPPR